MSTVRHKTSKLHKTHCVGIITIPHSKKTKYGQSHIMKAYVDWFEERNVRVIPIPYDTTQHEMYFNMVNGLFIPGGETPYIMKQQPFIDTVTRFFELSLERSSYFPIWGTCFGFELLMFLIGGFSKLKRFSAHGLYPIHITRDGWNSRLFGSMPSQYLHYLEEDKSTAQNHEWGISVGDFLDNDHLRRFYNILATSKDDGGKEYVAAIEGKFFPVYGVDWHPERQSSPIAGLRQPTAGHFADFFISELKKNSHKCKSFLPHLRTIMKPHKCTQYPEHKGLPCYFF